MSKPTIERLYQAELDNRALLDSIGNREPDPTRVDLPAYAWPGGYPMHYATADGAVLCSECATTAYLDPDAWPEEKPAEWYIYWEGCPEYCEECGRAMESALGQPFPEQRAQCPIYERRRDCMDCTETEEEPEEERLP